MKPKSTARKSALLALAGISLGILPAGAATTSIPADNDLLLGIRASGGLGQETAYLVNLGQYSTYSSAAPGSSFTLSLGNIAADLADIYGAGWSTRTDLYWGIVGSNSSASPGVIASRESGLPGWQALALDDRGFAKTAIQSVLFNGYAGKESTANSDLAVAQTGVSGASSWLHQVSGTPLDFAVWSSIETSVGGGADLELYRIATSGVSNPGSFSLGSDGSITFNAIPEPSVSLLAVAGVSALVAGRRRRPAHA